MSRKITRTLPPLSDLAVRTETVDYCMWEMCQTILGLYADPPRYVSYTVTPRTPLIADDPAPAYSRLDRLDGRR